MLWPSEGYNVIQSKIGIELNTKKTLLKGPIPFILVVHFTSSGIPRTHFRCIPTWAACSSG